METVTVVVPGLKAQSRPESRSSTGLPLTSRTLRGLGERGVGGDEVGDVGLEEVKVYSGKTAEAQLAPWHWVGIGT